MKTNFLILLCLFVLIFHVFGRESDDFVYNPSEIVRNCHNILHLNEHLQVVSNDFQPFQLEVWNDYTHSLLPIPIICSSLGILGVLILQFFLILRYFWKSFRLLPTITMGGRKSLSLIKYAIDPRVFLALRIVIVVTIVLLDEIIVFGNQYFSQGVSLAKDSIDNLNANITDLLNQGYNLNTTGIFLQQDLYLAYEEDQCIDANSLANEMSDDYFPYVLDFINPLAPLPTKCTDAQNNLHKWGEGYKNSSIWVIYSMYMILVGFYIIGLCYKNQMILRISVGLGELAMLFLFILIGVEMVILIGLGDFCMDPVNNLQGMIPKDIYNITAYYTTCNGLNPLDPSIASLQSFVNEYSSDIYQLLNTTCSGNTALQDSLDQLQIINSTLYNTIILAECPPIQASVEDCLGRGLCEYSFQGIYVIWLGQYITTSFVLLVTIVISYVYQFFGDELLLDAMNGGKEDENGDDKVDEEDEFDEETGERIPTKKPSIAKDDPNESYAVTSAIHYKDTANDQGEAIATETMVKTTEAERSRQFSSADDVMPYLQRTVMIGRFESARSIEVQDRKVSAASTMSSFELEST